MFRPNHGAALPNVEIRLVAGGNTIDSKQSGPIADNTDPDNWIRFAGELNPGSNTSIDIQIRTNAWANWGCDFVMDDIKVYQIPESCAQTITRTVVIPSGQEFKGSVLSVTNVACNGYATGKATLKVENLRGGSYMVQISPSYIARTGAGYTTPINSNTF